MSYLDLSRWDAAELAARWREARPFPHLILDELLAPAAFQELRESVAREPHLLDTADFYEFMASAQPMQHANLLAFERELGSPEARAFVGEVTGKAIAGIEMRSYVYLAGSYLLPHSDYRAKLKRIVSYAYYLVGAGNCRGGELELYDCVMDGEDVVSSRSALTVEPRANRLVLFDVSAVSLHQVREVLEGGRVSLAGWYQS